MHTIDARLPKAASGGGDKVITALYTQRVETISSYNERRDCADQRIASFISVCGLLPIPLPNMADMARIYIDELNPALIILTGGNSLVSCGGDAPERDAMDAALIGEAVRRALPLYGFCRGMQSILHHYDCPLVNTAGHVALRHKIAVCSAGGEQHCAQEREVNSYHNQACMSLNDDAPLVIVAKSADGVIEAVKHKTLPIIGTMWHPERNDRIDKADIEMVRMLLTHKREEQV